MSEFGILNSRKRAWIALAHSIFFLGVALAGFTSRKPGILLPGLVATSDLVLVVIYTSVAAILLWLVMLSRCARERMYFALCASSATFGLLRTIFGDAILPVAQCLRVVMLTLAIMVGVSILRALSGQVADEVFPD